MRAFQHAQVHAPKGVLLRSVSWCPSAACALQVLDPVSAPKWRLDCNRCNFLIYLPPNLHSVKVSKTAQCEVRYTNESRHATCV